MPLKLKPKDPMAEKYDTGSLAGLSLWGPGLDHRPGHVGFIVDKVALGQVFCLSTSIVSSQYHSTNDSCAYFIHLARMLYDFNSRHHC
jgi:hypothetical protein